MSGRPKRGAAAAAAAASKAAEGADAEARVVRSPPRHRRSAVIDEIDEGADLNLSMGGGPTVHDDFLRLLRDEGLEDMGAEVGLVRNGEIPGLRAMAGKRRPGAPEAESPGKRRRAEHNVPLLLQDEDSPFLPQPSPASMPAPASVSSSASSSSSSSSASSSATGAGAGAGLGGYQRSSLPAPLPKKTGKAAVGDKNNKGLRHFSLKVCRKVEEKGVTSYNEVADDLVREYLESLGPDRKEESGTNIRRRVYDALNVLMAIDIITKRKKEIHWKGLPSNAKHDLEVLKREKVSRQRVLAEKKAHLQELLVQNVAFKNLVTRNRERREAAGGADGPEQPRIHLPFITVSTSSRTVIQCEMSEDRTDVFFNFSAPFEVHDDNEILRRLQLHRSTPAAIAEIVPAHLLQFVPPEVFEAHSEPPPQPQQLPPPAAA